MNSYISKCFLDNGEYPFLCKVTIKSGDKIIVTSSFPSLTEVNNDITGKSDWLFTNKSNFKKNKWFTQEVFSRIDMNKEGIYKVKINIDSIDKKVIELKCEIKELKLYIGLLIASFLIWRIFLIVKKYINGRKIKLINRYIEEYKITNGVYPTDLDDIYRYISIEKGYVVVIAKIDFRNLKCCCTDENIYFYTDFIKNSYEKEVKIVKFLYN